MYKELNNLSGSIDISFKCTKCGTEIEESLYVPEPNWNSEKDTYSNSLSTDSDTLICPECGHKYPVVLGSSFCGAFLEIEELDEDYSVYVDEPSYGDSDYIDSILDNVKYYKTFKDSMNAIDALLYDDDIDYGNYEEVIYKMAYIQMVVYLETFLSDALITKINENESLMERFIDIFDEYKSRKISFCNIKKEYKELTKTVNKDLSEILYHNISKVGNIYKKVFDIDFNFDNPDIHKIISKRHDLVHRNGKTKEGTMIVITEDDVKEAFDCISDYVKEINEKLGG